MSHEQESNGVPMQLPEPTSEQGLSLRSRVGPKRWRVMVLDALHRVKVLRDVRRHRRATHESLRTSVRKVAPELDWSTYLGWRRRFERRAGADWERLLDARVTPPPPREPIDPEVANGAVWLRRGNSQISCVEARDVLAEQFPNRRMPSDASLRRIWRKAGLSLKRSGDASRFERVEHFAGGGGLALVGAAATEFAGLLSFAVAAQAAGREAGAVQVEIQQREVDVHRDENGRFTAAYNEAWRDGVPPSVADGRWASDRTKSQYVQLSGLSVLALQPETLSRRLLALGMVALVTDRRGFDGLDGPRARWLKLAGIHDYKPSTLDKTLTELALLQTADALWREYGRQWAAKVRQWSGGDEVKWHQVITYIDITADPFWTRRYALSGKVSRVGRVMPCLGRVAVMGGCGFPLLMDTKPGTVSLKAVLLGALADTHRLAGPDEMCHLTVVDAEAVSLELLTILNDLPGNEFITVLKGAAARGVQLQDASEWQAYRQHDQIRSGTVVLQGRLRLFAVEMQRKESRHPHPTVFITSARPDLLAPDVVCDAYLSRWPHQESRFKEYRNGAGLNHSHGFGGEMVAHLALPPKKEAAKRKVENARNQRDDAKKLLDSAATLEKSLSPEQKSQMRAINIQAQKELKKTENALIAAEKTKSNLETTPDKIFERDTTRENIATVMSITVAMLVEWVLREYIGSVKMELRTFLEYFLYMPTEVRTRGYRVLYRLETSGLPRREAELVRKACEEITRRKLRRDGRLLVFEAVPGSSP